MISIDDHHPPSDPSSSHNHHQEKQLISHDLQVSDLDLKFSDAANLDDINNPLPNFSIRDYVFGIRSKDISCNWPFSPTSLQLCLKHGVRNLLPPFQSIDSLRNYSSLTRCSLENRLTGEKLITSFDGKPKNDQFKSNDKIALLGSVTTKSKEKDKPQKPEKASSIHTIIKKSRFITKVNSVVEQIALNSENMASKVCPVCKVFSSSSNTTLNAHIDQCLSGEGTMKWTENPKVNVVVKHRIKPRKMRLMMEIYKTAPHCTIEELDRRNGTSWATNSNFPSQEFQFQDKEEEEKEEPKKTPINPEVANNEGDVYIDTDGTKIRILSVSKSCSSAKRNKIIIGKKKNIIFKKKHQHKYLKHSPNGRKLCLPKPQERSGQEDDNAMKVADLGILRPAWACSKRTGLSKKKPELQCCETKDLVGESDKSSSKCDLGTPLSSSDNTDSLPNRKKMRTSLSFPAVKFSLKRKFSAAEESNLHLNEKSVDGHSQDSLKEHSRTEEQAASSSNVESVRNETLILSNVPSFMGLSTSFDPEFSKQVCVELYQDQICSTNRAPNDVENRDSYCHEVEPILIPGPPGSFLPASPGGEMVSEEEIQKVTVLSIENQTQHHHDHIIDRDSMSNSPVSTVSNSRSTSVQDGTCKNPFFNGDTGFTDKGLSHNSFKNDQPCCCSRKEGAFNYQDSYFLRKQPIESNRSILRGFNFKSELFSLAPETVSFPTNKKFAVSSDCDSVGSPSKPVLRLMGKNLTVVKTDEDEFRPPQSSQQHPQQPMIFSQYQNGFQSQHFNIHPPINMRSHGCPYPGSTISHTKSHHGHNVFDFQTKSVRNVYNDSSSSNPVKEVFIIDDSPESEAKESMRNEFYKRNQGQMNPSYTMYPSYGSGSSGGSTVFRGGSFQTSLGNEDLGKWNVGSPSMSHFQSTTSYYP